jgi:ATP-dependent DNA helicase RecQ
MIDALKQTVAKLWGFSSLRPLQEQAMCAVLDGRDSLVVLPTGGGKSLCYQAPAVYRDEITVVVSPLISLMKDQVDGLRANGISAVSFDSSQDYGERSAAEQDVNAGHVRLLFVSPERLVTPGFQSLLQRLNVRTFAIDEAHCISHWGHDFRPEYRQLGRLHELFPEANVHAYTATATEQVRRDICKQLALRNPEVLVGNFDRPNLTYRVLHRSDLERQVLEVIDRHAGEAGIIYCIRRKDVDELTDMLRSHGRQARPYHAGMAAEDRIATQNAFSQEQCDLVVATVAFGMGIDRSNIRFVLHTGMPKSIEHYQQETGRAGRDGLEAECVLLHSGGDFMTWKRIVEKSAEEAGAPPDFLANALKHLEDMSRYATGAVCRHRALVQYFGQKYEGPTCHACDLCLGDVEMVQEAQVIAQKILSCVARVKEGYGVGHLVSVLRGQSDERIVRLGHDKLSTYALLADQREADIRNWTRQLIDQGVLLQVGAEYPVLKLNPASWEVMRGQRTVRLVQTVRRTRKEAPQRSASETASWEGVDRDLFEELRQVRRRFAEERDVKPYLVFGDETLRELARIRPSSLEAMRLIYGIGDTKLREFGQTFLDVILTHCKSVGLPLDVKPPPKQDKVARRVETSNKPVEGAWLFRRGASIEEVMQKLGRARSTVVEYLQAYILKERPATIAAWVPDELYQRVAEAARKYGSERMKPIFIGLGEQVSYDDIRLVVAHLTALGDSAEPQ